MANNEKQKQGSQHHHPQAAAASSSLENKERVVVVNNAQIAKLQGSMESLMQAQVEFQRTVLDELRQIRFGVELKFPVLRFRGDIDADADADHHHLHPLDWLSRAERFFNFYKVPEDQRVALASNYFEGRHALEWLILFERTTTVPIASSSSSSWTHFVEQFLNHFGYGDIDGSLKKLKQQGGDGVDAFITDFIRLVNRASKNWSDNKLQGIFIHGLQDELLRGEVRLYKPETLSEAMQLARVLEERPPPQVEKFIPELPRYQALFMGKTRVKVLITSSTHNFISPSVLKEVDRRLIIKEDDPLMVKSLALAGIGDEMKTTGGRIDGVQVNLQGFHFTADFYLLPNLSGCDMMLGNPWQCSLDVYRIGSTEDSFMANGKNYQLTAEKHPPGTITQPCCMSVRGIRKSKLRNQ